MFNLSDRISNGRMRDGSGSGFRANTADFGMNFDAGDRGSTGDMEGSNTGGPHSSAGFKRALMHTERTSGRLSGAIASKKDFSGDGFKKPNYFAQGGRRRGMHIGSGSPATIPAQQEGADAGGV